MRKVLLVDDEILVRVGLKSVIDWEREGYVICAEAADGQEALDKIRQSVPDIVLTDLMMDRMNGFELIKTLRKDYPQIGIIVLSCYNDFDNVKEAMRLGAKDYIFKLTLKPNELLKILKFVEEDLDARPTDRAKSAKSDPIVFNNINAIKANMLKKGLAKSYSSLVAFGDELAELGVRIKHDVGLLALIISIDGFHKFENISKIKEKNFLKLSMINIADEVLQGFISTDVFDYSEKELIILFNVTRQLRGETLETDILNTFQRLKEYYKRYLGIGISGGVSSVHIDMQTLDRAVAEAEEALTARFIIGNGSCHIYGKTVFKDAPPAESPAFPDNLKIQFLEAVVQLLDEHRIESFVDAYFNTIVLSGICCVSKARSLVMELLYPFINAAKIRGLNINDLKDESGLTPYQVIMTYDTLEDIRMWFAAFTRQFLSICCRRYDSRSRRDIIKVMEYVYANISDNISIDVAAGLVYMSKSYFSHLFKKEVGESFVDYVNRLRIEKAKELIANTDYMIYEIAAMVGVNNANYFCTLFKKLTGKSPNDFRA
jgi:two-component system response regulator YesN